MTLYFSYSLSWGIAHSASSSSSTPRATRRGQKGSTASGTSLRFLDLAFNLTMASCCKPSVLSRSHSTSTAALLGQQTRQRAPLSTFKSSLMDSQTVVVLPVPGGPQQRIGKGLLTGANTASTKRICSKFNRSLSLPTRPCMSSSADGVLWPQRLRRLLPSEYIMLATVLWLADFLDWASLKALVTRPRRTMSSKFSVLENTSTVFSSKARCMLR
mmetsp:Transcript_50988/g.147998  ORF Transcript_50988/g.147998 Transcript_50988/m.147998 type:complete len:215 (-) Transcript_50988:1049-1693(-)